MTHRTTLALDEATVGRIKKLARVWGVSQSEAVRRAVAEAEVRADREARDPLRRLQDYHRRGGLDPQQAELYLREAAESRAAWRDNT